MGITRKRLSRVACARSELQRLQYVMHMQAMGYQPEHLAFLDETGTKTREWQRAFGRSVRCGHDCLMCFIAAVPAASPQPCAWVPAMSESVILISCVHACRRGFRAHKRLPFVRGRRFNMIGVMSCEGLCALEAYLGNVCSETLFHFMLEHVLKNCGQGGPMNPFPGRCSVLVMDNASVHHSRNNLLKRLCEARGERVEYLPAYSPDLNPIENLFSACKSRIRRNYRQLCGSRTPVADLKNIFCLEGTPHNAQAWFQHAGYYDL